MQGLFDITAGQMNPGHERRRNIALARALGEFSEQLLTAITSTGQEIQPHQLSEADRVSARKLDRGFGLLDGFVHSAASGVKVAEHVIGQPVALIEVDHPLDPLVFAAPAAAGGNAWTTNIKGTNNVALRNLHIQ